MLKIIWKDLILTERMITSWVSSDDLHKFDLKDDASVLFRLMKGSKTAATIDWVNRTAGKISWDRRSVSR